MENKQYIVESNNHNRPIKEVLNFSRLTFEDRLFLDAIMQSTFPERLKQKRPKLFNRLQGRLKSMKRDVIRFYRKEQKWNRRRGEQ